MRGDVLSVRALSTIAILALLSPPVVRPVAAGGVIAPTRGVTDRVLEDVGQDGVGQTSTPTASQGNAASWVRKALRPKLMDIKLDDAKAFGGALGSSSRPASGIKDLPSDAVAVDVRFDYVVPDTNIEGTTARPDTLIACKSFLVHPESVDPYGGDVEHFKDLGGDPDLDRRGGEDVAARNVNIVAIEPMPGMHHVHHMHLHVCSDDSASWARHRRTFEDALDPGVDELGTTPAKGDKPLYCAPPSWDRGSGCHGTAWTFLPGQNGVLFPEGVGMRIGDGPLDLRRLILEVHYDKANEYPRARDRSGIRLWTVPRDDAVVHRAGVFSVADPFARLPQSLPPGEKKVTYDTFCPPGCTRRFETPMNVFASMTHAHLRARRVVTSVGTPRRDRRGARRRVAIRGERRRQRDGDGALLPRGPKVCPGGFHGQSWGLAEDVVRLRHQRRQRAHPVRAVDAGRDVHAGVPVLAEAVHVPLRVLRRSGVLVRGRGYVCAQRWERQAVPLGGVSRGGWSVVRRPKQGAGVPTEGCARQGRTDHVSHAMRGFRSHSAPRALRPCSRFAALLAQIV